MLAIMLTFFTSCQFSENIYIDEDGTGKMSFTMDGSELMEMMGDEMSKGKEESIDSIISFKELFKEKADSISKLPQAEQDKIKQLENFKMHMHPHPPPPLWSSPFFLPSPPPLPPLPPSPQWFSPSFPPSAHLLQVLLVQNTRFQVFQCFRSAHL